MQLQYLNENWSKVADDDWRREEVILLDNNLVLWIWPSRGLGMALVSFSLGDVSFKI